MKRQVTLDIFSIKIFLRLSQAVRCHLKWALKASIKSFTSCLGVKSPFPKHHLISSSPSFFLLLDLSQEREKKTLSNGSSFVWKFSKGQYPLRTFAQITLVTKRGESWSSFSQFFPNKTQLSARKLSEEWVEKKGQRRNGKWCWEKKALQKIALLLQNSGLTQNFEKTPPSIQVDKVSFDMDFSLTFLYIV